MNEQQSLEAKNEVNIVLAINVPLHECQNGEPLRVLTEAQFPLWTENGYVVVPNVNHQDCIDRTVDLIWEFEEKDGNGAETWYTRPRPGLRQYLPMFPARKDNNEFRDWRIEQCRDRVVPEEIAFPEDPCRWEQALVEAGTITENPDTAKGV